MFKHHNKSSHLCHHGIGHSVSVFDIFLYSPGVTPYCLLNGRAELTHTFITYFLRNFIDWEFGITYEFSRPVYA